MYTFDDRVCNEVTVFNIKHGIWPFRWKRTYIGQSVIWFDYYTNKPATDRTASRLFELWKKWMRNI